MNNVIIRKRSKSLEKLKQVMKDSNYQNKLKYIQSHILKSYRSLMENQFLQNLRMVQMAESRKLHENLNDESFTEPNENYVTEVTDPDIMSAIKDEIDNESTKTKNSHAKYFSTGNYEVSEQKTNRKNSVIAWAKESGKTQALRAHFDSKRKEEEE